MEEFQNNLTDGYWSDAINSDEMKAFLKKNYKIDIKYLLVLVMFFVFELVTALSGNEEASALALAIPQLTGKASETAVRLGIVLVVFAVFMFVTNRKDVKRIDGTIASITVGSVADPNMTRAFVGVMRPRVARYDITLLGDNGERYTMETLDKDISEMYQVGEKARFHDAFKYIEKYHKSEDDILFCPSCKKRFSEEVEICDKCGCPQLR